MGTSSVDERFCVLGAGGHAKVVIATARAIGLAVAKVFDDRQELWGTSICGVPVDGPLETFDPDSFDSAVLAVGDNAVRQQLATKYSGYWEALVHPSAFVHSSVEIGGGTVVFAGAVVQPDVTLGQNVIVNSGAVIDHDCVIGDFAHVAPNSGLAGKVSVGQGALVGIGASILPGVTLGAWSVVGAGAAVTADVEEGSKVGGVPARSLS